MLKNRLCIKKAHTGGKEKGKRIMRVIRAAHGRAQPEGVNEKMLTIPSHQHQPRHAGGGEETGGVCWKR